MTTNDPLISRRTIVAGGLAAALLGLLPGPVAAQSGLAAAKASGLVGERPDGLVGAVPNQVPADVAALVDQVNAQRKAQYQKVAQETGQSLQAVMAIAGQRLVAGTPSGQFVLSPSGQWVKK